MKIKVAVYKSLREDFNQKGQLDSQLSLFQDGNGTNKITNGYLEMDSSGALADQAFISHKTAIGAVPQIDGNNFQGDSYTVKYLFNLIETNDNLTICRILSDVQIPKPGVSGDTKCIVFVASLLPGNFIIAAYNSTGSIRYFDGTVWTNIVSHTGKPYVTNKWYICEIKREKTKYILELRELDNSLIIEVDLPFEDFYLTEDLIYSNEDTINGETADYWLCGDSLSGAGNEKLRIDDLFISTPIQFLGYDIINIDGNLTTNRDLPSSMITINNSPNNNEILNGIKLKYADKIKNEDEIILYIIEEKETFA